MQSITNIIQNCCMLHRQLQLLLLKDGIDGCYPPSSSSSPPDPPGSPRIQGLSEGEILNAGSLKRVKCTAIAGNPLARLEWFIGDRRVKSHYATGDNFASAELELVAAPADNMQGRDGRRKRGFIPRVIQVGCWRAFEAIFMF